MANSTCPWDMRLGRDFAEKLKRTGIPVRPLVWPSTPSSDTVAVVLQSRALRWRSLRASLTCGDVSSLVPKSKVHMG